MVASTVGQIALATGATVATTAYSVDRANARAEDAKNANDKLRETEAAVQASQAARARRQSLAKGRVERARIQNMAANQGQGASSAAMAGESMARSQAASNVMDINSQVANQNRISEAQSNLFNVQNQGPDVFESILTGVGGSVGGLFTEAAATKLFEGGGGSSSSGGGGSD